MRYLALLLLTGCMTIGVRGGPVGAISDVPVQRFIGTFEVGTFFGTERLAVNPYVGVTSGPLGGEAVTLGELGMRAIYSHPGFGPSPYVRAAYGGRCPEDTSDNCGITSVSLGIAAIGDDDDGTFSDRQLSAFASASIGITYQHHGQDSIGRGSFVGLEVSIVLAGDIVAGIRDKLNEPRDPDSHW